MLVFSELISSSLCHNHTSTAIATSSKRIGYSSLPLPFLLDFSIVTHLLFPHSSFNAIIKKPQTQEDIQVENNPQISKLQTVNVSMYQCINESSKQAVKQTIKTTYQKNDITTIYISKKNHRQQE